MKTLEIAVTASGNRDQVNASVATQVKQYSKDPIAWPVAVAVRDSVNRALPAPKAGEPDKTFALTVSVKVDLQESKPEAAAPGKGKPKAEPASAQS